MRPTMALGGPHAAPPDFFKLGLNGLGSGGRLAGAASVLGRLEREALKMRTAQVFGAALVAPRLA